jgi:ABC-type nitrate/sulfonate/bicarbonate transport system substrate-binding protein
MLWSVVSFVLATFFIIAGIKTESGAQDKLTVAMLQSPTQTPVWVALESGFFKEHGLEIIPVQFSGGTQTIMALMSGEVQMTTTGGPAAVNAKLSGGSSVIIGTTVGVFPYTFYVAPAIKRPEDLKGKRIGLVGFGGVTHSATRLVLQRLGLNPESDVTLVQMGLPFSNHLAAMASGSIQGAIFQFPETQKATELGFKPMLNLAESGIKFCTNQISTTNEYVKNNRDKVKRFLMAFVAGVARVKEDRDFTMKVLRKYLRISDPKLLAGTYDYWVHIYPSKPYVDPEEVRSYLVTLKDKGTAKPEDFIDNSIMAELDREGFIEAAYSRFKKR